MPPDNRRTLVRFTRIVQRLEDAPGPVDARLLDRAGSVLTRLATTLCAGEIPRPSPAGLPEPALLVFAPRPLPGSQGWAAWHGAQADLFVRYGPVAAALLGPASQPGERAHALLLSDLLDLLARHAAGLGRDGTAYRAATVPPLPFAHAVARASALRSAASGDVNLGAVTLALAIESGFRTALAIPAEARISIWRLFRAMAEAGTGLRLGLPLPELVALYNWAARHRVAGTRGFGWLNFFACDLLRPLLAEPFGFEAAPALRARLRDAALASPWGLPAPAIHLTEAA
ncbi:hypothetical protein P7D22_18245 [Lichenihabitans sp. Uapishka_5]|uniref:hypothetical protein n=1 Tax=Lichenihabitans sp. Uapishka_5 TaxID=3037302 RepID=UPI0029E80861|nr:hypothetical protein [Lichenihabitans sp. Uapishka_5]MDX7953107.1 hypothetical protein [Lichenihabitans sp. Uapishka_5]